MTDLVGHHAFNLFGLEEVENPLGDHDPHVAGVMPVGKGVGCPVVDQAEPGHLHVLFGGDSGDELAKVRRQLVDRDPRELVNPAQCEVHQPRARGRTAK